ncbi:MAG: potassium channel family protein, partial [Burkholderiales bacterium]|nr:potassium channel family protein [Anaerolineae bacterium]
MDSFKDTRRQIIIALVAIAVVISIGVIGFMVIEGLELLDSIWLTVITLATIGYGDVYARSVPGRVFTIFLIFAGISVFAFGLQATASFFFSPIISDLRRIRRAQRRIDQLTNHYIICGDVGELVDQAINSLLNNAERRRASNLERVYRPLDHLLDRLFGDDELGHYARPRAVVRRIYWAISRPFLRGQTLLDVIVVIASDPTHADELRDKDMLVIEGKPTDDITLRKAGVERAHALMVMLGSDSEALLTVLTARSYNAKLYITAA